MRTVLTILTFMVVLWAAPAAAAPRLQHDTPFTAKPRAVAAFSIAQQRVEVVAVTQKARADTSRRRAHLDESATMGKVMPGYPQPAFVSVDVRLRF